jgi:uncharacterized Zn finger protein
MADAQFSNKLSSGEAERLRCPMCQADMEVLHLVPGRPGYEHWTLRCTECGLIHEAQAAAAAIMQGGVL